MKKRIDFARLATSVGTVVFIWMLIIAGHSAITSRSTVDDPPAITDIAGTGGSPMVESS